MSGERRPWSFVSQEQFTEYCDEASKIVRYAQRFGIPPFAAGIAGVAMIRMCIELMGGTPDWWCEAIRAPDGENPFQKFLIKLPPGVAPPTGRGGGES